MPYNAVRDKVFFSVFGRLHPRHDFPHVALIVMDVITAIGSLFTLTTIIDMLTAVIVIVRAVAQIIALAGWSYAYVSAGHVPIELSLARLAAGVVAYACCARVTRTWPFGAKQICEAYLELQEDADLGPDSERQAA